MSEGVCLAKLAGHSGLGSAVWWALLWAGQCCGVCTAVGWALLWGGQCCGLGSAVGWGQWAVLMWHEPFGLARVVWAGVASLAWRMGAHAVARRLRVRLRSHTSPTRDTPSRRAPAASVHTGLFWDG